MAAVLGNAAPAGAHTLSGSAPPTNYRSRIISVTPASPGIRVRLFNLGRRIEVVNRTADDVVVLGYLGEPYLRVGPRGVEENRRAPSLYRNRPAVGGRTAPVPASADASAPPQWHRIGGGRTVRWADQRTRWEGADAPVVRTDPGATHLVVPRWTVVLQRGPDASPVVVEGQVAWVPGPSPLPWIAAAVLLLVATVVAVRSRAWGPLTAAAVAVLVAVDVMHTVGQVTATVQGLGPRIVTVLLGGLVSVAAWAVGVAAIGPLQESRRPAVVGAGITGFVVALVGGVADVSSLGRSQLPFAWPPVLARGAVAVSLGVGVGVVVGAFVLARGMPPAEPVHEVPAGTD